MTIRLLRPFNGYQIGDIVSLGAATETALVNQLSATFTLGDGRPYQSNDPFDFSLQGSIPGLISGLISAAGTNSAILAQALSKGGIQKLPPGKFYVNAGALRATKPGILQGCGKNNGGYFFSTTQSGNLAEQVATTTLATVSRTDWILGVDISGFKVENVHFQNESAVNGTGIATAGGGIRVGSLQSTTGYPDSQANGFFLSSCSFYGCYIGVDVYSSDTYNITGNTIHNFVSDGIRIQNLYNPNTALDYDFGDPIIDGNQITSGLYSALGTGIRWRSGGGVKIIGNKINGNGLASLTYYLSYGILYDVATPVSTSVFIVNGNSIEGITSATGYGLAVIYADTTANIGYMTIAGNEFQCTVGNGGGILLQGIAGGNLVSNVTIGNNVFNNTCFAGGISLSYCQGIVISPNMFGDVQSAQSLLTLGEVVQGCTFYPQKAQHSSIVAGQFVSLIKDISAGTAIFPSGAFQRNEFICKYSATVYFPTKQVAAVIHFLVAPANFAVASMILRVTITGNMAGVGAIYYTGRRVIQQVTAGSGAKMFPVSNVVALAMPLEDQVIVNGTAVAAIVSSASTATQNIITIASGSEAGTAGLNIEWNTTFDSRGVSLRTYHTSGSAAGATNAFNGQMEIESIGPCGVVNRYVF